MRRSGLLLTTSATLCFFFFGALFVEDDEPLLLTVLLLSVLLLLLPLEAGPGAVNPARRGLAGLTGFFFNPLPRFLFCGKDTRHSPHPRRVDASSS